MPDIDIITYPQRIGATNYLPADKIDLEEMGRLLLLNDRLIDQMREQGKLAVATPENYRIAVQRRPADSPWPPHGFTEAFLIERGFIDAPDAEEPKKAPGKEVIQVTSIQITADAIGVGEYRLQPLKRGNFTFWTAATAEGKILRAKSFKKSEDGVKFLQELSTPKPPAGTAGSEAQAESADGGDVRSGAEHPEG